jgi:hypothetical protein
MRFRLSAGVVLAWLLTTWTVGPLRAGDLGVVPLFDGERFDSLNLWGGPFTAGANVTVTKQSTVVRTGNGAMRANLGAVPNESFRFFQTFSSAVNGTPGYRQDRDLTFYQSLEGYVRNDTGAEITFSLELKDYRDSGSHVAKRSYTLPAGGWTKIEAPLNLANGWNVTGAPDLKRTFALSFLVDTDFGAANGSLYLDDFTLRENGPSIDPATAPIDTIVERLAHRQFNALWAARNKTSGLVPNTSDDVTKGALNTTTGVVWTLPAAVRRGWVSQVEADSYMGQLVSTLNTNRNQTDYLPTRFLNLVTGAPDGDEESSIDASFMALALHNYKSQPTTSPALQASIDTLQNRFNFAAFNSSEAFRLAYFPGSGFTPFTYAGYTHENKVIALAAEVSDAHHVPLETQWNKDVGRTLDYLTNSDDRYLVYSYSDEFRAPFNQALINLFVDTSERGVDSFGNRTLARNPWVNFQKYHADVAARLEELGRPYFFQPDAGRGPDPDNPSAITYNAWNLFRDFGQPDLFHPWSVSFALLAGAENAEEALRYLVDNGLGTGLDDPLGMADWAMWPTGAGNATSASSATDNWNMTLSLLAFMEWLDRYQGVESASQFFASLAGVDAALDNVFVPGDLNGNGMTNSADLAIWQNGYGTAHNASPAVGDADGDGDVDGRDFLFWQRGFGSGAPLAGATAVPEPAGLIVLFAGIAVFLARRR